MSWRVEYTVNGWVTTNGVVVFQPDQFGYVRGCSYPLDALTNALGLLKTIQAAGIHAMAMVQPRRGRYGQRGSDLRQMLCAAYASMLDRSAP